MSEPAQEAATANTGMVEATSHDGAASNLFQSSSRKRGASDDLSDEEGGVKRQKPNDNTGAPEASSRPSVIVPTLLSHKSLSPAQEKPVEDPDATDDDEYIPDAPLQLDPPIRPETYEILPPAQRINPASSLAELLIRNQSSNPTAKAEGSPSPDGLDGYREEHAFTLDDYDFDYLPPPLAAAVPQASTSLAASTSTTVVDLTNAPSPPLVPSTASTASTPLPSPPGGSLGSTLTSAILIGDSPTPPLRPLASPKARMEASASGRCNVLGGEEEVQAEASPEKEEAKITLGELVCPVCLGPPTPLVFTECGHAL